MTKNQIRIALDTMLEQGNQLRASELIPALNKIMDLIPESTGGGGSGVPVVEIKLPDVYNMENFEGVIYPGGIDFEIPAEKAAILDKNPCAIIASKVTEFDYDYEYFFPLTNTEWYRMLYDASSASEVTSNILTLRRPWKDTRMRMSLLLKSMEVVKFVSNQEPSYPLTKFWVPTIKAVYDEINKTK